MRSEESVGGFDLVYKERDLFLIDKIEGAVDSRELEIGMLCIREKRRKRWEGVQIMLSNNMG